MEACFFFFCSFGGGGSSSSTTTSSRNSRSSSNCCKCCFMALLPPAREQRSSRAIDVVSELQHVVALMASVASVALFRGFLCGVVWCDVMALCPCVPPTPPSHTHTQKMLFVKVHAVSNKYHIRYVARRVLLCAFRVWTVRCSKRGTPSRGAYYHTGSIKCITHLPRR